MTNRAPQLVIVLLALGGLACGHKSPPVPPPLMNPAPTSDLAIQQRGDELILQFTYPQTTVSGLPLATLEKVEFWELVKPLQPADVDGDGDGEASDDAGGTQETAGGTEADAAGGASSDGEPEAAGDEGETPAAEGETAAAGDEVAAEADAAERETTAEAAPTQDVVPVGAAPEVPLPPPPTKEQEAAVEWLEFDATAQIRLVLEAEELVAATVGDKIVLRLSFSPAAEGETAYIFAVKTFSDAKRVSGWSNLATLVRREPPATPEEFAVEAQAGGVLVTWFNERAEARKKAIAEATAAGLPVPPPAAPPVFTSGPDARADETRAFRVYRRDAQARSYGSHIGQVSVDGGEYLDRTAQYGNRYIYSLTAVGLYSPLVESALAGEIEIDYQDRFAPPAPRNPVALAESGRVRILWDASPAPDLKGYVVFRRQPGSSDFSRLNVKPTVDLEYSDRDVAPGTEYEYRIAAVDRMDNQGEPSVTVSARTP